MSDAAYIELPPTRQARTPFFRSWKGAVVLLFFLAALVAGWFSWWLSEGKVSSAYARVDTVVFTVEPEMAARVEQILVRDGEDVTSGQPLAAIDPSFGKLLQQPPNNSDPHTSSNVTEQEEKRVASRLAKARADEAVSRQNHHDRVTEHVRAQLYLRSISPADVERYEQASNMEQTARMRMNQAREEFEKISKHRGALDLELARIHYEISRKRPQRRKPGTAQAPTQAPAPVPPIPAADFLYAPVAGRIVGINLVPGQTIYKSQPVFMIMPTGQAADSWIQAWFPISSQTMLKPGQKATIKAGDLHLTGTVANISSEPQYLPDSNAHGQYAQYIPVQILISDQAEMAKLKPGTNVQCQIQTRYVIDENAF